MITAGRSVDEHLNVRAPGTAQRTFSSGASVNMLWPNMHIPALYPIPWSASSALVIPGVSKPALREKSFDIE